MARIRSVHPGLFTDEAFVSLSPLARVLFIGLWCEADDGGAFEWKPISIKMRLLPADNADVPSLLSELEGANVVKRYVSAGREYGAVRNFCRYQRPKKPKSIHPMPPEFRTYVASDVSGSEPDDDEGGSGSPPAPRQPATVPPKSGLETPERRRVPKKSEISPQMEDGGWRRERDTSSASAEPEPAAPPGLERRCRAAVGEEPCLCDPNFAPILALLEEPGITEADVLAGIAAGLAKAEPGFRFRHWRQFANWIRGAAKDRLGVSPRQATSSAEAGPSVYIATVGDVPRVNVDRIVSAWRNGGPWHDRWGPPPDDPDCRLPAKYHGPRNSGSAQPEAAS